MTTTPDAPIRKKLIEVSIPLEDINAASAHEKSVPRKGHPATMHLWWALTCFSSNVAFAGFDQSTPGGSGRWLWL